MKTVCKKLLCLMLVAMMLVSAVPFAFAASADCTIELWIDGNKVATASQNFGGIDNINQLPDVSFEGFASQQWADKIPAGATITVCRDGNVPKTGVVVNVTAPQPEAAPSKTYGTLTIYVRLYDANKEVREHIVTFQGEPTYTLNVSLAEAAIAKAGFNNSEEFKWQSPSAGTTLTMDRDHEAYLIADPIWTPGNREIVTLTINHNRGNGNDDRQTVETLAGTKILDVLSYAENKGYFDEPSRKGYRLAGYSFDMNCSDDIGRDDTITKDMTIFCEWERDYFAEANKYDVTLRVYANGDAKYVDKVLDLDDYAGDGKITRSEVEKLLNKKYTAKSGYSLAYYGLFTAETWDDGDYDVDDAVSTIKVNDYGKTVIYVMVKNVKKAVADDSNPKTGDNIMIAVSTMALSAAALVSIVELKKRKMI